MINPQTNVKKTDTEETGKLQMDALRFTLMGCVWQRLHRSLHIFVPDINESKTSLLRIL